jgi:hypothetical protein
MQRMSRRAKLPAPPPLGPLRQCVGLHDLTDCLLEAYERVARRAHAKYVERGAGPGSELDDWLTAERELLLDLRVDITESADCVYALASVANPSGAGVHIGIEARWLVIVAPASSDGGGAVEAIPADVQEFFCAPEADAPEIARPAGRDRSEADMSPLRSFSIRALPTAVDPARSVAVLSAGVLGIRMPKVARSG